MVSSLHETGCEGNGKNSSESGPLCQAVSEGCNKNGGGNRADKLRKGRICKCRSKMITTKLKQLGV